MKENEEPGLYAAGKVTRGYPERRYGESVPLEIPGEKSGKLPDLIVTKGGVPFADQAEGIRQFKEACLRATEQTEKLAHELDITNADHTALWLEENMQDASLGWLACRIVEAHERALANSSPTPTIG